VIHYDPMSRATHDAECFICGFQGTVNDEAITCPRCGLSIEGQPVDYDKIMANIQARKSAKLEATTSVKTTLQSANKA